MLARENATKQDIKDKRPNAISSSETFKKAEMEKKIEKRKIRGEQWKNAKIGEAAAWLGGTTYFCSCIKRGIKQGKGRPDVLERP